MEASRFGFNLPPAYKFDPTDAEIVAHYLLPCAAGLRNFPFSHALLDDDTCSCPPWELLRRHGHGGSDHAFFVGAPGDPAVNSGRASRGVRDAAGEVVGYWRGQKGQAVDLVVARGGGGGGMRIRYRRYNLTYYRHGDSITSGWVMHEYHILEPKMIPGAVLSRVKITGRGKKEIKKQRKFAAAAAAAKKVFVPGPDQPGPSNYLADEPGPSNYLAGEPTGGFHTSFLNTGEDENVGYYDDDGSNNYFDPDQPGPSSSSYHVHDHFTGNVMAPNDGGGAGTSGVQADVVHLGGEAGDVINGGGATGEMTGINEYTDFYNYDCNQSEESRTATATFLRAMLDNNNYETE